MRLALAGLAAAGLLAGASSAAVSAPCAPGELEYGGFGVGPDALDTVAMTMSFTAPVRGAVIVREGSAAPDGRAEPRAVWVSDVRRDKLCYRKLLSGRRSDNARRNLLGLDHPVFSLDGGLLYVLADAWATSAALHQVDVRTGAERFVIDANSVAVVRTGPHRGLLLVSRHKDTRGPAAPAHDPVDLIRPDGQVVLTIPGGAEHPDRSVARWLRADGGQAY